MPAGIPKWIRCYDNRGETWDRYTVVFTKYRNTNGRDRWGMYVGMSSNPFSPQGFGQRGEFQGKAIDTNDWGFAPMIGKKNHLGVRIPFDQLPDDCKALVIQDYSEIWGLGGVC